ncbi:MAG: PLP-dependent aminotransferase family protein [Alphaproteobacteria bacterium]|nr:PLP-dependent aminotransferase family protein [Alphaproteobacteria bacterium]
MIPSIALDQTGGAPLYRQIYERVREAIGAGTLRPGEKLPSARSLASQLGIARGTADAAYALLAGEGYIVSRGPAGTQVSPQLTAPLAASRRATAPPPHASAIGSSLALPFRMGLPALDLFPRKLWSRLAMREARIFSAGRMADADPAGYLPLREAIAAYLAISRGIASAPSQIFITGGYQGALDLVARVLLRPGNAAWVEDPGYVLAREALAAAGARVVPVRVDDDGMRVEEGIARAPDARFVAVTPSHQSPLGVALSLPRRLALLAWAKAAGAWVIEDDYDSEFRYTGHPLPALKSLDLDERVLYAGSFSKVLFPALRLGYLLVPEAQVPAFSAVCRLSQWGRGVHDQAVVAAFMAEGHFPRHLKRMRGLYGARRAALASALTSVFGDRLAIELQAGGMHLLARVAGAASDVELVRQANAAGLAPTPLSDTCVAHDCGQGLLLSFTNIAETDAPGVAQVLERAIGPALRPVNTYAGRR